MRDNDPKRRAPGRPADDDDVLADTFVDDEDVQIVHDDAADQSGDEFADMTIDTDEPPAPDPAVEDGSINIDFDDDHEQPRVLQFVSTEVSMVMQLPTRPPPEPEPDAPKTSARRTTAAQLRHDLRTPFNQIIGYSEMLIEDAEASNNEFI